MVDFKRKLAEQRLKEKMEAAIPKPKPASMVNFGGRGKKIEAEPLPDVSELDISDATLTTLAHLIPLHVAYAIQERQARNKKKPLTEQIKGLIKDLDTPKFMCDSNRVNYYNVPKTTISRELLLANGVSPTVIAACTTIKDSWYLKITPPSGAGGAEDDDEE